MPGQSDTLTPAQSAALPRPRLRGVSHVLMVPIATVMAVVLVVRASGIGRLSVAVFATLFVGLFATSGSYHVLRWTARAKELWGRADAAMIVLFVVGTFTPIAFHALDGPWRVWSLVVAWAIALVGVGLAVSPVAVPRWAAAGGFLGVGWLGVVPMWKIAAALPVAGTVLILVGGALYTIGAIVYATRRPDPFPAWFGFHEIFHLFVVAAATCHYVAILRYVT